MSDSSKLIESIIKKHASQDLSKDKPSNAQDTDNHIVFVDALSQQDDIVPITTAQDDAFLQGVSDLKKQVGVGQKGERMDNTQGGSAQNISIERQQDIPSHVEQKKQQASSMLQSLLQAKTNFPMDNVPQKNTVQNDVAKASKYIDQSNNTSAQHITQEDTRVHVQETMADIEHALTTMQKNKQSLELYKHMQKYKQYLEQYALRLEQKESSLQQYNDVLEQKKTELDKQTKVIEQQQRHVVLYVEDVKKREKQIQQAIDAIKQEKKDARHSIVHIENRLEQEQVTLLEKEKSQLFKESRLLQAELQERKLAVDKQKILSEELSTKAQQTLQKALDFIAMCKKIDDEYQQKLQSIQQEKNSLVLQQENFTKRQAKLNHVESSLQHQRTILDKKIIDAQQEYDMAIDKRDQVYGLHKTMCSSLQDVIGVCNQVTHLAKKSIAEVKKEYRQVIVEHKQSVSAIVAYLQHHEQVLDKRDKHLKDKEHEQELKFATLLDEKKKIKESHLQLKEMDSQVQEMLREFDEQKKTVEAYIEQQSSKEQELLRLQEQIDKKITYQKEQQVYLDEQEIHLKQHEHDLHKRDKHLNDKEHVLNVKIAHVTDEKKKLKESYATLQEIDNQVQEMLRDFEQKKTEFEVHVTQQSSKEQELLGLQEQIHKKMLEQQEQQKYLDEQQASIEQQQKQLVIQEQVHKQACEQRMDALQHAWNVFSSLKDSIQQSVDQVYTNLQLVQHLCGKEKEEYKVLQASLASFMAYKKELIDEQQRMKQHILSVGDIIKQAHYWHDTNTSLVKELEYKEKSIHIQYEKVHSHEQKLVEQRVNLARKEQKVNNTIADFHMMYDEKMQVMEQRYASLQLLQQEVEHIFTQASTLNTDTAQAVRQHIASYRVFEQSLQKLEAKYAQAKDHAYTHIQTFQSLYASFKEDVELMQHGIDQFDKHATHMLDAITHARNRFVEAKHELVQVESSIKEYNEFLQVALHTVKQHIHEEQSLTLKREKQLTDLHHTEHKIEHMLQTLRHMHAAVKGQLHDISLIEQRIPEHLLEQEKKLIAIKQEVEEQLSSVDKKTQHNERMIEDIEQREKKIIEKNHVLNKTQKLVEDRLHSVMQLANDLDTVFVTLQKKDKEIEEQKILLHEQKVQLEEQLQDMLAKEKELFAREKEVAQQAYQGGAI